MGVILAFAVGYVVGAGAGRERLDEVIEAMRTVRDSEEFAGLLEALKTHTAYVLEELGQRLRGLDSADLPVDDLLERAKRLLGGDGDGSTSRGS